MTLHHETCDFVDLGIDGPCCPRADGTLRLSTDETPHPCGVCGTKGAVETGVSAVTLDEILELIGFGRTQMFVLCLCGIGWFVDAVEQLGLPYVFIHIDADWGTGVKQWGVLASCKAVSGVVGALGFSAAADKHGRRRAFITALATTALAGVASALAQGFQSLLLLRIITNIGAAGLLPVAASLLAEHLPPSSREACVVLMQVFFDAGFFVCIALSLLLGPDDTCAETAQELHRNCTSLARDVQWNCTATPHGDCVRAAEEALVNCTGLAHQLYGGCGAGTWRIFVLALAVPAVLLMFVIQFVPESPSHLLHTGHRHRLQQALAAMARRNQVACIDVKDLVQRLPTHHNGDTGGRKETSSGFGRLWERDVRRPMIAVALLWAGCAVGSEFFFWVTELGKAWAVPDRAVKGVMLIGRCIGPVAFILASIASRFGYSKYVLTFGASICSVSTAAIAVLLSVGASHLAVACALLALNFFFDMVWGVVYSITLATFDASCRASALSVGTSCNKVAAFFIPFLSATLLDSTEGRSYTPFICWALGWAVAAAASMLFGSGKSRQ